MNTFDSINSAQTLRQAILDLEIRQDEQREKIHVQFGEVYESVKPINLIKSTLQDVVGSMEVKDYLVNTGVGLVAGYLGKRMYVGSSESSLKNLIGTGVMFIITTLVTKNPETVKSLESNIVDFAKNVLNVHGNTDEEE